MKRTLQTLLLLVLILLLTTPCIADAAADSEKEVQDLSRHIRIEQSGHSLARDKLLDRDLEETISYAPFETIRLTWSNSPVTPATLCIQWGKLPERVRLRQTAKDGTLLADEYAEPLFDGIIHLADGAVCVTIMADSAGMDLARLALFSEGTLPSPFLDWQDTPKGMDYMIIATHPDDDVLFMGGIIPTYGSEQGYVGTVVYVTNPSRRRVNEAMLGAWEMGTTYRPMFLGFQDIREVTKENYTHRFLPETVTLALVRMLREYRPLVVFSHDVNGEYGHWQHKIVSAAVLDAVRLCADPTYDVLSYEAFGAWEVKKCYIHLYPDNPFVLDVRTPLASRGGRTALEVAQDAYKKHQSQQGGRHFVQSETDRHALNRFGMAYGTVEVGTDVFDNIDPALLSTYTGPSETPTPDPTSEPSAEPTADPAAELTEQPTQETAAGTDEPPTATPDVQESEPSAADSVIASEPPASQREAAPETSDSLLLILFIVAGVAVAALIVVLLLRRRQLI